MMTKNEQIKNSIRKTRQKRSGQVCRVFKVKIDESKLSARQVEELKMLFVEAKWFYNWLLARKDKLFEINAQKIKSITKFNKDGVEESVELNYLGSSQKDSIKDGLLSSMKSIKTLVQNGHQKFGKLRFKSEVNSIELKQNNITHKIFSRNKMRIQGIFRKLVVNGLEQIPEFSEIANAKLLQQPDGYFVAITTYINKDSIQRVNNGKTIGIDFGCSTSLTYSDGRKTIVEIEESDRLKMLQKKLSRQKGFKKGEKKSNNFNKTKKQIQKAYKKLNNQKSDKANKIVHELKQYNKVVIQNEQLKKWHSTIGLSKHVQHSILGSIKSKLMKMDNVVVIASNIPTTKICLTCGKVHEMKLSDREFKCCTGVQDRDIHAAQNMIQIVDMINEFKVPTEHREVKREEFLTAYEKKFKCAYGTLIHEANPF